jgi:hypothetical protein
MHTEPRVIGSFGSSVEICVNITEINRANRISTHLGVRSAGGYVLRCNDLRVVGAHFA